ncbi:HNH endonuclease [Yoonia sp. 2307UL14-13]|uniref:HNH endonuclease n=1 Tax=Yoonia sp. 2307UL14-13 TaxID=3126506 RepID=UPI00309DE5B3
MGQWLDKDGNPAERGDGVWHPNGGTDTPIEYKNGFPDFSGVSEGSVEIPMRGNRLKNPETGDFGLAERAYKEKYGEMPDGYYDGDFTWHHKEDGATMELVPFDIHDNNKHTGGVSLFEGQHADNF